MCLRTMSQEQDAKKEIPHLIGGPNTANLCAHALLRPQEAQSLPILKPTIRLALHATSYFLDIFRTNAI